MYPDGHGVLVGGGTGMLLAVENGLEFGKTSGYLSVKGHLLKGQTILVTSNINSYHLIPSPVSRVFIYLHVE